MLEDDYEEDPEEIAALEESERQIAAGEAIPWKEVKPEIRREFPGK